MSLKLKIADLEYPDGVAPYTVKWMKSFRNEAELIKYRVQVEVEYFITLCELPLPQLKGIDSSVFETLRNIYRNFSCLLYTSFAVAERDF